MSDSNRISQLERELLIRDQLISELRRQLEQLKDELEAWKRGHRIRDGQKLPQKKKTSPPLEERKPGRKKGHEGTGRVAPKSIDRFEEVLPPALCPTCQQALTPGEEAEVGLHRVEEIVPPKVEVVGYRRHVAWCGTCRKAVRAKLPDGLGSNPKLGVIAQATIAQSKAELGLTTGQLCRMMGQQYGLKVSKGGVQQILHRAAQVLQPGLKQIQEGIKQSEVAWADETPWKVWGTSAYMWLLMTRNLVWFEADPSRSKEVPRRMLQGFKGTVHSDFYGSYYAVNWVKHAACWAHLTREARQLAEREARGDRAKRFYEGLQAVYREAAEAQKKPESAQAEAERLKERMRELEEDKELKRHKEVKRLQKRLVRHREDLLRFVTDERLEGTNNRAERELRMLALMRHVSSGARSDEGAKTLAALLSVHRTLQKQGKALGETFVQARKAAYHQADFPILTPAKLLN